MGIVSGSLFVATLIVGLLAAYDLEAALLRFSIIGIGLAVMIGIGIVGRQFNTLGLLGVGCAVGGAGISVTYGLRLYGNSGATASALMILLPFVAAGVWWHWVRSRWLVMVATTVALVLMVLTLLMTQERTTWISLFVGMLGAGYLYWRFSPIDAPPNRVHRASDIVFGLGLFCGLVLYVGWLLNSGWDRWFSETFFHPHVTDTELLQRVGLWQESLAIAREYFFTGSGLGMTAMIYSTYLFSMHSPYWFHAHNIYLQIALEQGIPGLIAFMGLISISLGIVILAFQQWSNHSRWFLLATATALISLLTYGLFDAELYATEMAVVLFIPIGFAWALSWPQVVLSRSAIKGSWLWQATSALHGIGSIPILVIIVLCLWPGTLERLYVNLAVLTQTKAELQQYQWPAWPIQDELRRTNSVDLSGATAHYQRVLTINPQNPTAHRRLGQIALSRRDYQEALAHLNQAYQAEPGREVGARLLGEVHAVTGDVERAVQLWQPIKMAYGQVEDRLWWYGYLDAQHEKQSLQKALAELALVKTQ